jgi:hypothetical protein
MGIKEDGLRSVELARKYVKVNKFDLAVHAIECDICDRGGIKHEWSSIDEHIKEDIRETWKVILKEIFSVNN